MEQEQQERQVKGIWIPIEIWKDKNLSWNEKILFLEIDSYTSNDVDCFFTNEYIAELLGVNITNASKTLSSLVDKGYVVRTRFDGRKRYIKSALSYSTSLPCRERQPSLYNVNNNNIQYNNKTTNILKEEKESFSKKDELFEQCWIAYKRKGSKKKSKEYWCKISDKEKDLVLPHIKSYVASRDLQFQKDFERYLRDKIYLTIVYQGNNVLYDPTRRDNTQPYSPQTGFSLNWNDYYKCFMYTGYWDGHIPDGYSDEERPDGAQVTLNNGRGVVTWSKQERKWIKK